MSAPAAPVEPPRPASVAGVRVKNKRNVELALLIFAHDRRAGVRDRGRGRAQQPHPPRRLGAAGASLFALFLGFHFVIRVLAPFADPIFLPCVALLNGLGVAFLRRLDLGEREGRQGERVAVRR